MSPELSDGRISYVLVFRRSSKNLISSWYFAGGRKFCEYPFGRCTNADCYENPK